MEKIKVIRKTEFVFDILYVVTAIVLGGYLLGTAGGMLAKKISGAMAFVLAAGEFCRILPRMLAIKRESTYGLEAALGNGKQFASIASAVFFMLLWELACALYSLESLGVIGIVVYVLGAARIATCIAPVNQWHTGSRQLFWAKVRNVPFLLMGMLIAAVYMYYQSRVTATLLMWLAIIISFCWYLPVVLIPHRKILVGLSMMAQSCCYIWMLAMCAFL
jgi:hypothetical protein